MPDVKKSNAEIARQQNKKKKAEEMQAKLRQEAAGGVARTGVGAANECEENMVIFHKNRQMRTQPEAKKKTAEKTGKAANNKKNI